MIKIENYIGFTMYNTVSIILNQENENLTSWIIFSILPE